MTITLRPSDARGHAQFDWLDTRHSFSFADYYDPRFMGFRALRVINEDQIAAGAGFPTHAHANMEIVTYVTQGALEHKDSTGGHGIIGAGEVQRMTAGSGIRHSEFNASKSEAAKLLQIWIQPSRDGLRPGYEQKTFTESAKHNRLCPIATPDGKDGALTIQSDVRIYASILDTDSTLTHALAAGRGAWIQVVSGKIAANGTELSAGDAVAIETIDKVAITARERAEFLLFDLA
jgi:redox-sensitive bicupin YhaK (pirin superfamily)